MGFFFQSDPPVGDGVDNSINSVTSGLEGALSKLGKAFSDNIDSEKISKMVPYFTIPVNCSIPFAINNFFRNYGHLAITMVIWP